MYSIIRGTNRLDCISYGAPIQGQTALQTGFLVAFTQLIPEHQVQVFGKLRMRVKVSIRARCDFVRGVG
jgi:hypothetical protein